MSQEAYRAAEKSGLKMMKETLLEIIRKSPSKMFTYSPVPNSKDIVIVVKQM